MKLLSQFHSLWSNPGPDSGWSWIICLSFFVYNVSYYGLLRSSGVVFNTLLHTYNFTPVQASWPFSVNQGVSLCAGLVSGHLALHFSCRWVTFFCILASITSFVALYIANITFISLLIWFGVVHGFALGVSSPTMFQIVASYFKEYRTTALFISQAGAAIAGCILPPVIKFLIEEYYLTGAFLLIGCLFAQTLVFALFLRPRNVTQFHSKYFLISEFQCLNPNSYRKVSNVTDCQTKKLNLLQLFLPDHVIKMIMDPAFWLLGISSLFVFMSFVTNQSLFVAHVVSKGYDNGAIMLSVSNAGDFVGIFLLSYLSDKHVVTPKNLYTLCMAMFGLTLFIIGLNDNEYVFFASAFSFGFSFCGFFPLRTVLVTSYFGIECISFAVGIYNIFTGLASFTIPNIIDTAVGDDSSFSNVYYLMGGSVIVGVALWCGERLLTIN